jgi:hypothetical protein
VRSDTGWPQRDAAEARTFTSGEPPHARAHRPPTVRSAAPRADGAARRQCHFDSQFNLIFVFCATVAPLPNLSLRFFWAAAFQANPQWLHKLVQVLRSCPRHSAENLAASSPGVWHLWGRKCYDRGVALEHPSRCEGDIAVTQPGRLLGRSCNLSELPGRRSTSIITIVKRRAMSPHRPVRGAAEQESATTLLE